MAGAEVPVWPCEHFLPAHQAHRRHRRQPADPVGPRWSSLYIRDDSGGLLIGCFEPMGKAIDPGRLGGDFAFRLLPEDWDHFEPIVCAVRGSPTWARQDGRSPCPVDRAGTVYDALHEAGARRAGVLAQTSMWIEKCFPAYGHDLDTDTTPLDAGLGFAVRWDKDFQGGVTDGCTYLAKGLIRRLGRSGFRHFRRAQMRCRLFGSNLSISAPELRTRQRAGDRIPGRRPVSPDGAGSVPPPRRPARQASVSFTSCRLCKPLNAVAGARVESCIPCLLSQVLRAQYGTGGRAVGSNLDHGRFPKGFAVREKPLDRFGFGSIRIEAQTRFELPVGREIRSFRSILNSLHVVCRSVSPSEQPIKAFQNPPDEMVDAGFERSRGYAPDEIGRIAQKLRSCGLRRLRGEQGSSAFIGYP